MDKADQLAFWLSVFEGKGVTFWVEDATLQSSDPSAVKFLQSKGLDSALIERLGDSNATLSPQESLQAGKSLLIKSRLLGDSFYLVAENTGELTRNGLPVYTLGEMMILLREKPALETLKYLHYVKQATGGTIDACTNS